MQVTEFFPRDGLKTVTKLPKKPVKPLRLFSVEMVWGTEYLVKTHSAEAALALVKEHLRQRDIADGVDPADSNTDVERVEEAHYDYMLIDTPRRSTTKKTAKKK